MKVYLSERERATLVMCVDSRMIALRERAKEEGWRASELAMSLADLSDVMVKLEVPKKRTVRK